MFCSLKDICRLCGKKAKMCIGVFSPEGEAKTLERKIRMCLPITVSAEDCMPKQVCFSCVQKLETAYDLYLTCNSAQTVIKRLLKLQHSLENSNPSPKACFIEQCERERNSSKECMRDVRTLDINVSATPHSSPSKDPSANNDLLFKSTAVPSSPIINPSVIHHSSPPAQNSSSSEKVGQSPMPSNFGLMGPLRIEPQPSGISYLQSVGHLRSIGPVPPMTTVFNRVDTTESPTDSRPEPVDSKENILINFNIRSDQTVPPLSSPYSTASTISANVASPVPSNQSPARIDNLETPAAKRSKSTNGSGDGEVACKYCGKLFSENVITLHQNLHLRVKFFSCVACDKNFTTEIGLNKHRCESEPPS